MIERGYQLSDREAYYLGSAYLKPKVGDLDPNISFQRPNIYSFRAQGEKRAIGVLAGVGILLIGVPLEIGSLVREKIHSLKNSNE